MYRFALVCADICDYLRKKIFPGLLQGRGRLHQLSDTSEKALDRSGITGISAAEGDTPLKNDFLQWKLLR